MNKQLLANCSGSATKTGILPGWKCPALLVGLLLSELALAQQPCVRGMHIEGIVTDPTGAVIAGARVRAASRATAETDATGHYVFSCVPGTSTTITADAEGFARGTAAVHARGGGVIHLNLHLTVAPVETDVQVNANASGLDTGDNAGSTLLGTAEVQ